MQKKKNRATACLFLTALIWGVAFSAQRAGMDYVGSLTFNGVRFALGALSLLPAALLLERDGRHSPKRRLTLRAGFLGGIILFPAATLQQFGVQLTGSAGKSGFITGLYIVLVPLLGAFLGRKPTVFVWAGAGLACAGLYLLSAPEGFGSVGLGDAVLLAGALFWAFHILLIDRYAGQIFPICFSIVQFLACAALSLTGAFLFEEVRLSSILAGYVPILYASLLSVGIAYTLQVFGQRYVEPAKAAIIFSTEALFSAVGAAVILGETMAPRGYIGCAFIFMGILFSQLSPVPRKERSAPSDSHASAPDLRETPPVKREL